MADDTAFRSQQFAQQATESVQPAQQNMQRSLEHFSQTMAQGVEIAQQGQQISMQQQELAMRKDLAASSLAMDRIRKQQAMEELNWSRELHTTAMLENERRISTARANLAEDESAAARKKLNQPPPGMGYGQLSDREMALIRSMGGDFSRKTGEVTDASPEMQAQAKKDLDQQNRLIESQIAENEGSKTRMQGDYALQRESLRLQARLNEIEQKLSGLSKLQDDRQAAAAEEGKKDRSSRAEIAGKSAGAALERVYAQQTGATERAGLQHADANRLNALKIEQDALLDRREGLKSMPIGTPAEKKARDAEAADITKGIKAVQDEAKKLREGANGTAPAAPPQEEVSDTALDDLLKQLLQPEPKK